MNVIAIIQARTNSTRLPKKIMLKFCEKPLIEILIERIKHCKTINKIIIATTRNNDDDIIEQFCIDKKIDYVRGSENDVLSRHLLAAEHVKANVIVRVTSDNPLIDPNIIDEVVSFYLKNNYDYVSNYLPPPRTYPDGMAVEVFSYNILKEVDNSAHKPSEREHPTLHIWMNPKKYKIFRLDLNQDFSNYRVTLDYPEDYSVIKSILNNLYSKTPIFNLQDIIDWLDSHPDVKKLNSHILPDQGLKKSLEDDKNGF